VASGVGEVLVDLLIRSRFGVVTFIGDDQMEGIPGPGPEAGSLDADFHGRENNQSLRAQGPSFLGDLPHRAPLWLIVFSAQSGSFGFVSTFSIS
jgi:hypothetical protein